MFKVIRSCNFLTRRGSHNAFVRFFLSKAYKCEEAWSNRLKNPLFSKIDSVTMYHDLDLVFQNKQRVSVLDVDILLNSIRDPSLKNEVEDVLLRLRLCPECSILPERASHAAIRYFMDHCPKEDILNVLGDRINYGLFPDYHLTNMLMDKFLQQNDACTAVKIAVLQMLQEDFDHPIMKVLALHCCYNYLQAPDIWTVAKEPEPDPDEEPIKVRVRFIKNPYFDDHFDIGVPNHLVGKTLWLFGHSLGGSVGVSSQVVGLVLYEKYDKCVELLESVLAGKTKLYAEAVTIAREYTLKKPKQMEEEGGEGKEKEGEGKEKESEGKEKEGEGKEKESEGDDDADKKRVLALLERMKESELEKGSLLAVTGELVKEAVKEHESKDIEQLCQMYKRWEEEREEHIKYEVDRAKRLQAEEDIRKMKEDIEQEEQRLFFFDKLDEIEMVAEENEKKMQNLRRYKPKGREKAMEAEEYIPPTV